MAVLTLFLGACAMEVESADEAELEELEAGAGINLLGNPGFETGPGGGGTVRCPDPDPENCQAVGHWGLHGSGALRTEWSGRFHDDGSEYNWGLEISKISEGEFATQAVAATPGRYRFRLFAHANDKNSYHYYCAVSVLFYGAGGSMVGGDFIDISSYQAYAWDKWPTDVIAPAGTQSARVTILGVGDDGIQIDDVVLAPLTGN